MCVERAMYSFRMSFCVVPRSLLADTPCFSATATYNARRIIAVALIVMLVLTRSRGMPSNSASMSRREPIATPTFPTSPCAIGWSLS